MKSYKAYEFTLSTDELEQCYFIGEKQFSHIDNEEIRCLPPGKYKIVDGQLEQVISALDLWDCRFRAVLRPKEV